MQVLSMLIISKPIQVELVSRESISPEIIISIIALGISILGVIFEWVSTQRSIRVSLEADYYKSIYEEYLIIRIPKARQLIKYNESILSDVEPLVKELNDMRRASLFFKYKDKNFYERIYELLQSLEDKLVTRCGEMDHDKFAEFTSELNGDIEVIYETINKNYLGRTSRRVRS